MKKVLLVAALALVPAFSLAGKATAQEARYGTEVCVNASLVDEAKRLFPNATLHVLPDFAIRRMNGWRIVSGNVRADGRIHTDAEEVQLRRRELLHGNRSTSE
jgi:hypothetical protein